MQHKKILSLCEGAMCVALSFALSYIKIPTGGFGGSISLTMLPLMVFALRRGGVWGLGASLVYGFIDFFAGGGIGITWQSMLLDYVLAYTLVGLCGFFSKAPVLGVIVGGLGRYACLVLSGVFIWGEYMQDLVFFGSTVKMTNVWIYSLLYNAQYMILSVILCIVCIAVLSKTTKLVQNQWKKDEPSKNS